MIIPTSYGAAVLLLAVSFLCLGSWINAFKISGHRRRFELFAIDFALGVLVCSLLAAYTFGTLGSELSFGDRLLVASRTSQGFTAIGGFVFTLGHLLLLAGVSLVGISAAFPLSFALATAVAWCFHFKSSRLEFLVPGLVLCFGTAYQARRAGKLRNSVHKNAPVTSPRSPRWKTKGRTSRGLLACVLGGLILGLSYPLIHNGFLSEFGLAPYAGMLVLSISMLISTLILNFFFLRIAIEGAPATLATYLKGRISRHVPGMIAGALWAIGLLTAFLALSVPPPAGFWPALTYVLPLASVLLAMFWGTSRWKELSAAPSRAGASAAIAACCYAAALICLALSISS